MHDVKNTKRAKVRVSYDGKVHKQYFGKDADKRFENEVRILEYLQEKDCDFVPKLIEKDREQLSIVTTNCGQVVESISDSKMKSLFGELENFGVKHEDAFARNITYDARAGRFCIIDFEFATNLETGVGLKVEDIKDARILN